MNVYLSFIFPHGYGYKENVDLHVCSQSPIISTEFRISCIVQNVCNWLPKKSIRCIPFFRFLSKAWDFYQTNVIYFPLNVKAINISIFEETSLYSFSWWYYVYTTPYYSLDTSSTWIFSLSFNHRLERSNKDLLTDVLRLASNGEMLTL